MLDICSLRLRRGAGCEPLNLDLVLLNVFSAANLNDEEFSHRYYSTVVAKLEALVDKIGSFSTS